MPDTAAKFMAADALVKEARDKALESDSAEDWASYLKRKRAFEADWMEIR